MHRFYLEPSACQGTVLSLTGREAHHAVHVLRVRRGETVTVLDGEGQVLDCEIAETSRDQVGLKVFRREAAPPLPCQITLGQAVPKGKLFEAIIQKATELGVFRIVPLLTERVIGRIEKADEGHKLEKWRTVAIEASKQCGSAWLPRVEAPETIESFAARQSGVDLALVGSLRKDRSHPRTFFDEFEQAQGRKPASVSVAIGPEGDFTAAELSCLQAAGARPITLGPLVLRTETAAVYCLSVINYEIQANPRGGMNHEEGTR